MSEEHEPSYYVNESAESFESGLWNGLGADDFDPYTRFDVNYNFEAEFGLTTSESVGLEVPDRAAANTEQTQEACGAEKEREASNSKAFARSTTQQPYFGTENEPQAKPPEQSLDPGRHGNLLPMQTLRTASRPLVHMGQPPTLSTPGGDSGYKTTSTTRRLSHTMTFMATQSQEEDAVQTAASTSDSAWPGNAEYWASEIEDHSPADEEEWVHDHEQISNSQNIRGSSRHEQIQSDLYLGDQNFGQNSLEWEFPIDDFYGPVDTNVELQQQPVFNRTQRPSIIGDEKDDDPNDSDRDDEDDEDKDEEYYEEEDLSSQVVSVTYPVNDPLIVEDHVQKGWGRTGIRDGNEVWFNPKICKWRK